MNINIKNLLEGYFANVYSVISENYNIPVSDLENIFKSVMGEIIPEQKQSCTCVYVFERSGKNNKKGDVCGAKIKGEGELCSKHKGKKVDVKEKKKEKKKEKEKEENTPEVVKKQSCTCVYVFERSGKNNKKGDVCGVKIKGEGERCSKHKDKKVDVKEKEEKPKTKIPKPRVPSKKKNIQKEEIIEDDLIEKEINEAKPKVILKKHKKIGVFYHAETRFIFESPTERTIIGKLTDDDTIDPITETDEVMIKKYKFIVG